MLNPSIYENALNIIKERRRNAVLENENRIAEINLKLPEVKEINDQLTKTSSQLFKIIRSGKTKQEIDLEIENLKNQNLDAQRMIRNHLYANGYPYDYLDLHYICSECSDTGFSNGYRCECLKKVIKQLSVAELNKSSQISLTSFSSFKLEYYQKSQLEYSRMQTNLAYSQQYANNFSLSSPSILMMGGTGVGKTHLSLAIADTVLSKEFSVLYDSIANYLRMIEKEHFNNNSTTDTLQTLIDADLLILDDLGAEFSSPFYDSVLYTLINTRISRNLPTIISTNFSKEGMEARYEQRLMSRIMFCFEILQFLGSDVRQIKRTAEREAFRRTLSNQNPNRQF